MFVFVLLLIVTASFGRNFIDEEDITIKGYPYQLFLFGGSVTCGASIISEFWALTCASCLSASSVMLRASSTNRTFGGSLHSVRETIIHELYNVTSLEYDFGLVKVFPKFPIGRPGCNAVSLPWIVPAPGQILAMSGWGSVYLDSFTLSSTLRAADVIITTKTICQGYFPDVDLSGSRKFCAIGSYPGYGDQGGPMVGHIGGEQHGVIPATKIINGRPFIFASVASYRQWIYKHTGA